MSREDNGSEPRQGVKNQRHNRLDKRYQNISVNIRILGFSIKAVGKMPVDAPSALAITLLIVMTAAAVPSVALAVIGKFVPEGPIEAFALPAVSFLLVSVFGLVKIFRKR